jgi:hypothetical protein
MRLLNGIRVCGLLALATSLYGQGIQGLPLEPYRDRGGSVTGALEGWFKNPDGSFSFLLGYFNRSQADPIMIPVGPDNRIEPGGPDRGQPTWFLPGRQWGFFTIKVPPDFGKSKLTWTITANGQTTSIPLSLHPDYEVQPFKEVSGNQPPTLVLEEAGTKVQGPQPLMVERTATVGTPVALTAWVTDDALTPSGSGFISKAKQPKPVTVTFSKYRGPGAVTFSATQPDVEKLSWPDPKSPFSGKTSTMATFGAPGEYIVEVVANDYSGEGGAGFQCCWTSGKVKVTVRP